MSFSAIASRLGMRRSKDAFEAFHRALAATTGGERQDVLRQEHGRLASLEARIRTRDAAHPEKLDHRMQALEEMRRRLVRAEQNG